MSFYSIEANVDNPPSRCNKFDNCWCSAAEPDFRCSTLNFFEKNVSEAK